MNQETKLVGWFEGEPGDVRVFANESEARMFADGVFHGAAQYGCGSVEVIDINKVIDSSVYTLMQRMFEDGDTVMGWQGRQKAVHD